jgi:hypothetical protein
MDTVGITEVTIGVRLCPSIVMRDARGSVGSSWRQREFVDS